MPVALTKDRAGVWTSPRQPLPRAAPGSLTFHCRSSVKISLRAMSTRFHATARFSWWSQFSWPKWSRLREAIGRSTCTGDFSLGFRATSKPNKVRVGSASRLHHFN